jgi:hypothetical protein
LLATPQRIGYFLVAVNSEYCVKSPYREIRNMRAAFSFLQPSASLGCEYCSEDPPSIIWIQPLEVFLVPVIIVEGVVITEAVGQAEDTGVVQGVPTDMTGVIQF